MNYNEILNNIKQKFSGILGSNLVGIYVHGSIAFGCFNPAKSDIDFIAVVNDKLNDEEKLGLLDCLVNQLPDCPPKGIEMSVVLKRHCQSFIHPCPYELHFSDAMLGVYKEHALSLFDDDEMKDPDLAAHFTVIRHTGIVLHGEPISAVFGDISKEDYLDSIVNDVINAENDILSNPEYITLNLCRVLAYIEDGQILSKRQGGEWALEHVDAHYRELISDALECYQSDVDMNINGSLDLEFAAYMLDRILKYK